MLKQVLDKKIKESSLKELKNKLGYQSTKKFQKSIDSFLKTKTIYDWVNSGFYDLVNNAENFLIKLCNTFNIDDEFLQNELILCEKLRVEIEKFKDCYLFINTNFKRKNEPIFVLALLENKRRIFLNENEIFLFKSIDEILELIPNIVIEHYKINEGKCFIWGEIVSYQLHLFGNLYTYSIYGKLISEMNNLDVNMALLRLK